MNESTKMIAAAVGIIAISAISAYSFISTGTDTNANKKDEKETTRDSLFVLREEEQEVPPVNAEPQKFHLPEFDKNKNANKHKIISIKKRQEDNVQTAGKSKKRRKHRKKTKRKKN